ncbi:hypothetical protein SBC1_57390 (plasmid) [Caballeronia sp. SBC1]|uniref:hypothetical protein n=1 Tax=unclassified Caballeronia TaxID=2646786 RepID=UPI0013E13FFD|nr:MULTISPECIES: hypothetical protein [unclassified Caballeronia]QIE27625.1 hypothetical protein SBC2_57000 [Caballeronia sp. SBC2]QIN65693.1 hypothetical protein SBC1_57390 [Caballeronia sp. SBC1]
MLYKLHEQNRALFAPFVEWAHAWEKLLIDPVSPTARLPFARRIAAGYELMY